MSPAAPAPPPVSRTGPQLEWVASRYADVEEVLSDCRLGVPQASDEGPEGSIGWLRRSVSRFANGDEHLRRRALAEAEIAKLDPPTLYAIAKRRATARLKSARRGERIDVMEVAARTVPVTALAELMGVAEPERVAEAVLDASGAYFGGAGENAAAVADAAVSQLVELLSPGDLDVVVARLSVLIQTCDATAGLIGPAVLALADHPSAGAVTTELLLKEVLRHSPMLLASRRVALTEVAVGAATVQAGEIVICSVERANRDPQVFAHADTFDPGRHGPRNMTFGTGYRPCPGEAQAMMLAAAVVDAVRELCVVEPAQHVDYAPPPGLRIPLRVEAVLR
ncbi:MAG TPA: cytochrome P450 [Acidimicrobiales bacterium]|jgi:cytochrome P450|nr:cytochrome P450 [Acidimicrobiales bacterium]